MGHVSELDSRETDESGSFFLFLHAIELIEPIELIEQTEKKLLVRFSVNGSVTPASEEFPIFL